MDIVIGHYQELACLDDKQLKKVAMNVINRLGKWAEAETIKRGAPKIGLKRLDGLRARIVRFKTNTTSKVWFGTNALGVHNWGDTKQQGDGVFAAGESHKGAFINNMGGSQPIVWRRKNLTNSRAPIERVTKDISEKSEQVISDLSTEIQAVFDEFLWSELSEIL